MWFERHPTDPGTTFAPSSCISLAPRRPWLAALAGVAVAVWAVGSVLAMAALWQQVARHPLLVPSPELQAERAHCATLAGSAREQCLRTLVQHAFAHGAGPAGAETVRAR